MTGMFFYPDEVCIKCGAVPNWAATWNGPYYCDKCNRERIEKEKEAVRKAVPCG